MAFKSAKQRAFFHTDTAKKKGITQDVVKEFDEASKGLKLPTVAPTPAAKPLPDPKDPMPMDVSPASKSHFRK